MVGAEPEVLHWHLESSAAAVGRMRKELGATLHRLGVPDDAHDGVLIVANELAANAVEHASGPVEVLAALSPGSVRIAVRDGSARAPRLQPHDRRAPRGRGLQMVAWLARDWSWTHHDGGKTVWADVPTRVAARVG